jgi:hypothetical protein
MLLGVALAILGWYAPWVTTQRQLAALTFNALDLTEVCKFVVRAGIANITREWFLVPIIAAALALALWASQASSIWRYGLTGVAALLSLVPLPPFSSGMSPLTFLSLVAWHSVEDRFSFWSSVVGLMGVTLVFVLGQRIRGRWRDLVFITFALVGTLPVVRELSLRVLPALAELYASPALPTWGFFVAMVGFALVIVSALMRET